MSRTVALLAGSQSDGPDLRRSSDFTFDLKRIRLGRSGFAPSDHALPIVLKCPSPVGVGESLLRRLLFPYSILSRRFLSRTS